jgi:D-3-phosphoglycerate dehydrogenase
MADAIVEALIVDLLEWVASRARSYEEVMDAWRTSCPKLPVWEDANDSGLIKTEEVQGRSMVRITPSGLALLEQRRQRITRSSICEAVPNNAPATRS